ncbi:MAG: ATP-binding protein [Promethearchaeota archaeon]
MENGMMNNIELFTGRTEEINRFRDFLAKIKTGGEEKRGGILSGERGMGKTFTLMKFQELAQIERFQVIYQQLTPGTVESFFADLKSQIVALVPEKKKRFGKKEDFNILPLPKGTTTAPEVLTEYVDEFFRGLDDIQEKLAIQKTWTMFLIDNCEFFAIRDFENAYQMLIDILKRFKEKRMPVVIVFSILDEFMNYLPSELETDLEMSSLGKISSKEAEIFLKRVETKYDITIAKDVKDKLIRAGRGIPFFLALAISYLYENRENSSIDVNVWSKCKNAILDEDIVKLFDLNDEELKILENIASQKENLITILELEAISDQKGELKNVLNNLQEKKLLVVEDTFVYFSSQFLFQTLKRTSERLNIFGRANVLLDLFKESTSAGKRPDTQLKKKLDELKNIALAQRDTAILTEIAEAYSAMGETLIGQEMFYEAFTLFSSAIEIFEQIEDFERAALLCDEMAKRFSKFKKPYYARKFLAAGAKLYDKIGSDWKRNALSRNAAMLYEEAGDLYAAESFDAFTRLFYRRAYSLYQAANEGARAKKVCQKAREAISNEFYRKEFDKLAQQIVMEPKGDS